MEDEAPTCECEAGMIITVATGEHAAQWCIWCGIGWGQDGFNPLLMLKPGEPMGDVLWLEVTIPILVPERKENA
jgi:hypothetical protein